MPGSDSFIQEGNMFTEIVPPALKPASMTQNAEGAEGANAENELSSQGVSMSLVHTTSKLDLETRWLVQWEGERVHPILPAHSSQIQRFKGAICRGSVDATGLNTITSILDTLIGDLRPVVLPGESAPVGQGIASQHQQRFRESAQAILADLWMVGQRFKSVSPSHVEAARLIATKITPKGLDHQTVRLTLVPPSRRAAMLSAEAQGNSPIVDSSDGAGDSWNRNKNQRGMGNAVSSGGIGRGGNRGGRFDNNRGRGGAGVGGGAGRGGRGGFRGNNGNNNSNNSPGGSNSNSANADDMNFNGMDPSGSTADIMLSMTGKTQPVPYLATQPPTREELEESEQEYLGQLGEDGCLLKAYWGTRGAQGSAIASVLNSVTSLDAPSVYTSLLSTDIPPTIAPTMDPLAAAALAAQQKLKKLSTKRPRLQDFAGRTPVSENGGYSK
ncbi:hypothetical protein EDD11_000116 [Mortierella claussenii]|nr:hypothetical protein EDD11_000116 [Mortierella claussenii]